MGDKKIKFIDNSNGREYTEEQIRKLDFEDNVSDLINNKDDIIKGFISVESVCECIENSLNGDIKDVVKDLNACWGYDIDIFEKVN